MSGQYSARKPFMWATDDAQKIWPPTGKAILTAYF